MVARKRAAKKAEITDPVNENAESSTAIHNLTNQKSKRTRKEPAAKNVNISPKNNKTRSTRGKQTKINATVVENTATTSKPTRTRGKQNGNVTLAAIPTRRCSVKLTNLNESVLNNAQNCSASSSEQNQVEENDNLRAPSSSGSAVPRTKERKNDQTKENVTIRSSGRNNRHKTRDVRDLNESQAESHQTQNVQLDVNMPSTSSGVTVEGK